MSHMNPPSGRVVRTASNLEHVPIEHESWWHETVRYSKFNRQGIDIVCASFEHRRPRGVVLFVTGWSETFLKYPDFIRTLYLHGYTVYTYDHQSQGLSGRWLSDSQATWVHNFEDYVDDFVFYANMISRQNNRVPLYVIAHSMGCLISAIAMSRHPTLVSRAVFSSPLLRSKCAPKFLNYMFPIPFPMVLSYATLSCSFGWGNKYAMGFTKERPNDEICGKFTHDKGQLSNWKKLRQRYPSIINGCITIKWLLTILKAQKKFAYKYELCRTNTLILQASDDKIVHNRAQHEFAQAAPNCRVFEVPDCYHEILLETPEKRNACTRVIINYFDQNNDDVRYVSPIPPLAELDQKLVFSLPELMVRVSGMVVAVAGAVLGASLVLSGIEKKRSMS